MIRKFYEAKDGDTITFWGTGEPLRQSLYVDDLVDIIIGADGMFSSTRSFFEKRKNEPKFKKAIALRKILKLKSNLNIDKERISLMMGKNCHRYFFRGVP